MVIYIRIATWSKMPDSRILNPDSLILDPYQIPMDIKRAFPDLYLGGDSENCCFKHKTCEQQASSTKQAEHFQW